MKAVFILFLASIIVYVGTALNCGEIPIALWNGTPSKRVELLSKPINLVVIQHTVSPDCVTDEQCIQEMKEIREKQIEYGYDDIGISFVVGGNGKVYEGAGWHVGAHTRGYNDKSISISFIGDFRKKLPTPEALLAATNFISCVVSQNDLSKEYKLVGHQQLSPTLSPGAMLQSLIQTWPHWTDDISQLKKKSLS